MTLVTLPALRHRVQTRTRRVLPAICARIETRFGSHRAFVSLCAWLIVWPRGGPFPQIWARWPMNAPRNGWRSRETTALYSTGPRSAQTAAPDLRTPLQFLKGVGPRRAAHTISHAHKLTKRRWLP